MSLLTYVLGVVLTGVALGALAFGAYRARARWLPTWSGPPARLAEIAGGLVVLITVPQLLGVVGQFRRWPVALALVATGIIVGLVAGRATRIEAKPRTDAEPRALAEPAARTTGWARIAVFGAAALVVLVFAQWTGHVIAAYAHGIRDGDSLWYHLPFAAHFVQSGSTTRPLFTDANPLATYFPGNVEIVNGITMVLFRRDVLVPLMNFGWLALALLSGWCIGRRYGAPAVGLAAVAMVMSIPVMAATQAGTARNDVAAVALFLAAVALVVHAEWNPVALGLAGAVNGIAFGVKLSVIPVALLLAAGVVIIAPRARRRALLLPWLGGFVVFGSFWYLRNLVTVGNPVPWIEVHVGPVSLPKVYTDPTSNTAVLNRITQGAFSDILRPGMNTVFGPLWWLFLAATAFVLVLTVVKGRENSARMLGVVSALGIAIYIALPNGAPVRDGVFGADIFALNVRYAFPAFILAMVLVASLPRVDEPKFAAAGVGAFAVLSVAVWLRRAKFEAQFEWANTAGQRVAAYGWVIAIAASLILLTWWYRSGRHQGAFAAAAIVATVGAFALFYVIATDNLENRYQDPSAAAQPTLAWQWAQGVDNTRVGLAGALLQYPYVGRTLSNEVRWVGRTTDHGGFRAVNGCREWQQAVADGDYEYIIAALDLVGSNGDELAQIGQWTQSVPGTRVVLRGDREVIYRLTQTPDPDACP